jgi:hypothetical protein
MPAYKTNGAAHQMPPPTDDGGGGKGRYIVISDKLGKWVIGGLVSTILGGGWVLWPAKQRDLDDVRKDVAAHTVILGEINTKLDKIGDSLQEVRVDVARMQGGPPAPVAPAIRVRKAKPKPEPEKPKSIFSGF